MLIGLQLYSRMSSQQFTPYVGLRSPPCKFYHLRRMEYLEYLTYNVQKWPRLPECFHIKARSVGSFGCYRPNGNTSAARKCPLLGLQWFVYLYILASGLGFLWLGGIHTFLCHVVCPAFELRLVVNPDTDTWLQM